VQNPTTLVKVIGVAEKVNPLFTSKGDTIISWELNVLKTAIHLRNLTLL
jgi:hypothetical protein